MGAAPAGSNGVGETLFWSAASRLDLGLRSFADAETVQVNATRSARLVIFKAFI